MYKIKYGVVLIILLLMGGCATHHRSTKDGPLPYAVDVSRIPNAEPKVEPLSKYGNYATYHVFGKSYHTMKSSKNYQQIGTASWYGTKFHAQRTSSGERYDMLAMTAAHKTLPLPTYVEVTNLKNNKTIIVKVNDRGPFEGDRLIDLSYAAAKKLEMTGKGTATVRIKAIDPVLYAKQNNFFNLFRKPEERTVIAKSSTNTTIHTKAHSPVVVVHNGSAKTIYLQVGAFRNKGSAETLKKQLGSLMGSPVCVTQAKQKLFKVRIGPFNNIAAATHIQRKLQVMGFQSHRV
jgi:rare lipoprotein A